MAARLPGFVLCQVGSAQVLSNHICGSQRGFVGVTGSPGPPVQRACAGTANASTAPPMMVATMTAIAVDVFFMGMRLSNFVVQDTRAVAYPVALVIVGRVFPRNPSTTATCCVLRHGGCSAICGCAPRHVRR
jgi:hypothetical protein